MNEDLIISVDDLRYYCAIGDAFDAKWLTPWILQATELTAQKILGTALMDKLIEDYNASNLSGKYQELYHSNKSSVKLMVCWQALRLALPRMALSINNGSITRNGTTNGESASNEDIAMLHRNADATLTMYENKVKDYLIQNNASFPELKDNTPEFIKPNLQESNSTQGLSASPDLSYNDY